MPRSRRLLQLIRELDRLKRNLLPKKWNPTGTYQPYQQDRTRAYRVLVHAEIESYLEDVLLKLVEKKYSTWLKTRRANYPIMCLVAATRLAWQDDETLSLELENIPPPTLKKLCDCIDDLIEKSFEQYKKIVSNNNGIRDRDLKRLLIPVGIALSDLDQTWLNTMNSFGGKRGSIAHSSRLGIKNLPDPQTEFNTLQEIVKGLNTLDNLIQKASKREKFD